MPILRGHHFPVNGRRIGIGHDQIGFDLFAISQTHAAGAPFADENFGYGRVGAEVDTVTLTEGDERIDQCPGSSAREPHTPLALQVMDERVKTRRVERIPADKERLDAEKHAQRGVAQVGADQIVNGAVAAQSHKVGQDADHVGQRAEGLGSEFGESRVVESAGFLEQPQISALVERIEFADLAQGVFNGAAVVEAASLVVDHAIPRFDRQKLDVVGTVFAEECEQFVEEKRRGQNGRSGIVQKSVATEDAGPSAVVWLTLEERNLMPEGAESEGGSKSAETGTDDESVAGRGCDGHRPPSGVDGFAARWKMAGSRIPAAIAARCGAKGAGKSAADEAISSHRR